MYSAEHPHVVAIVRQVSAIDAPTVEREKPDLVVGRNLNATRVLDLMSPIPSEVDSSRPGDTL